jgi:hypothetical protein
VSTACRKHGRDEKYIQNLFRKLEGMSPFVRSRHRWEDTIKEQDMRM